MLFICHQKPEKLFYSPWPCATLIHFLSAKDLPLFQKEKKYLS